MNQMLAFLRPGMMLALAACLLHSNLMAQEPEIGLQLYSFRHLFKNDVPGTLQKVRDMGFKEIEGGGSYNLEPAAYKKMLEQNRLQMVSYGAGFEDLEKDPQKIADMAKFYGAQYVITYWVPHNGKVFTLSDAQRAVSVFNKAGEVFRENGLRFAYHPHGYEFQPYEKGTFFDYLVQHMDPRYANFQMDVFWFHHSGQDPVAWLRKMPERFVSLHLKDRQKGTPNNLTAEADVETNVVLGTGDVDIRGIMNAAWKAGIRHYFIEDESSRAETQVPQSVAFLKGLALAKQ